MMIDNFVTTSYPRNVLHFVGLAAARAAIAPFYLCALLVAIPTFLVLCVVCLPSVCWPCFHSERLSFYGSARGLLRGSDALPQSVLLFAAGYWPLVFLGLATMLALSPLFLVCCGCRRGCCYQFFQSHSYRSQREKWLMPLAFFSLWPCGLSLVVLFLTALVALLPVTLLYALVRAPRFGAQLDLPM
jgi:hypothetical protein